MFVVSFLEEGRGERPKKGWGKKRGGDDGRIVAHYKDVRSEGITLLIKTPSIVTHSGGKAATGTCENGRRQWSSARLGRFYTQLLQERKERKKSRIEFRTARTE